MTETVHDVLEPVSRIAGDADAPPVTGTAICLSGGGYRAMLFHTGVLWRLCETGWLAAVDRISSVSGGAMTAGVLATVWDKVVTAVDRRAAFDELVVTRVRKLASHTIDSTSIAAGIASPLSTIGEQVEGQLRRHLLGDFRLAELPVTPKFIFNATNTGSGKLVRFSRTELADWRVGRIQNPDFRLAVAVTAASAFPPFLSPYHLDLTGQTWTTDEGNDLVSADYRDEFALTDGGVYDNLGLETAWKRCRTLFVADAGGILSAEADPASDWARHMARVGHIIDSQVRALRKRQVIDSFDAGLRDGVYVGIRSDIASYAAPDALPAPFEATKALADVRTRLQKLPEVTQQRLINWGYAIADAGLRSHVDTTAGPGPAYPYPGGVA